MNQKPAPWIETFSGLAVNLLNPDPNTILMTDIAHSLARTCRFTGHVHTTNYSVAQHSCLVASILNATHHNADLTYAGLLHDAAEAYIGDVSSPLKALLPEYKRIEKNIEKVIQKHYEIPFPANEPRIKEADVVALHWERRVYMAHIDKPWAVPDFVSNYDDLRARLTAVHLRHMSVENAEKQFLLDLSFYSKEQENERLARTS